MNAKVVKYKKEKVPLRSDYTKISYPYVSINNPDEPSVLVKLRYASSFQKTLSIGQETNVLFYAGELLYWDTCNQGVYKYLPSKFKFWKE